MSDLIDRESVIEIIEYVCSADDTYWKPGTLEKIRNLPTHPTPSNTLEALDCVSREDLTKGIETYFGDLPIAVHYDMLALAQTLPSAQPKERCIATITLNGEDIERIVKEQVEEIKASLPRKGEWICQADDGQVVLVQDTGGTIWIWKYLGENLEYRGPYQWMDENGEWQLIDEVVAWMPLPDPYKEKEE